MNRTLITGVKGTLAQELIRYLGTDKQLLALGAEGLDVTKKKEVFAYVKSFKPEIIFHFAAKTNVDWCERHQEECYQVNVMGTRNIGMSAKEVGAILVFPSTYYVYGGLTNFPVDDRIHKPSLTQLKGVYARSKLLAEQELTKLGYDKIFILRLGSLFGGGKSDKKFVGKMLTLAKTAKKIPVVTDRFIQPTYIKDTIQNMLTLVPTKQFGTYNMVAHGVASFYDYARAIFTYAGIKNVKIIPIRANEFPENAPRTERLEVVNGKLQNLGLDLMRHWKIALQEYIQKEMLEYSA